MARLPVCILLFGLCTWLEASGKNSAITSVNGILGESVTLPLKIKNPQDVENIAWSSPEMSVAFVQPKFRDAPQVSVTHQNYYGRLNVSRDNYDLVISHLRAEDSRVYTANINTKHGKETETQRFSLHVYGRLGTVTITRSVTPIENGTCNVTLTCWVEGGENVTFSWTPLGAGPVLYLSQGPGGHKGAVTCTAWNPVSSSNASVNAELLCTDAVPGCELCRSWVLAAAPFVLLLVLLTAAVLLFLRHKALRQRPPQDTSSEKTLYTQVMVSQPADARVYDDIPCSKMAPPKEELRIYSMVQYSDKTRPGSPPEGGSSGMTNYANVV
ncbi:SLAM family member 5 isoform X1 [Sorex araneus]|uniref:SLAM family member 5 isoform X1 n=1 Tax=Sorex araneus TaxID=42254 RepID=UPI0024337489|nr:SLAM family member 5 isoform X1 [Sorex araneus]